MINIKKGLDLPIKGGPEQIIKNTSPPKTVAIFGFDYIGVKPQMAVKESDFVIKGQLLFTDKRMPAVRYTSPGTGYVKSINRGEKRALQSIVIELAESEEETCFESYGEDRLSSLNRDQIIGQLLSSGLWTALRARPFNKTANPETVPHSIFITAMDTNPLAPAIEPLLAGHERDFVNGARILARLTEGRIFLCKHSKTLMPDMDIGNLVVAEFSGPHPAGNAGTHIHFLDPVHLGKTVWHIGLQDVIAVGKLFTTGRLYVDRIVSLAGPSVSRPSLIRTRIGACLDDHCQGELIGDDNRIISGSVLSGHRAEGDKAFLGRYHQQISVLPEDRRREFLGWLNPGFNLYSIKNVVLSKFIPGSTYDFTTSMHGEKRAIIPNGNYERVMPLDIMPLFLLRALAIADIEEAENLGCLELAEEDLALCTFVCPSKEDFAPLLRHNLELIEEEISGGGTA
ncbi:Na(+)-translocating NADH-quinone reductase subunit A [Methylobacter sp. YRD-M1]|uniref:Na(+)-translocating NADH-quinone reductase subunit A n=1 Tax=Methylobacter sp. YRD-M1 TaxID=2911520 RepID=UPI00227AC32F|nr:Na(+)-translocating NADH-quinone reductase subunit A [Methylobacter sp. YRD-M1]WAK00591.1 Na(+)-translocating NADH-quinone reductase subunit A [Methylobacter sp. YRD-M1]